MILITKAQIAQIAKDEGCDASYSGEKNTFFLHGEGANEAFSRILQELGPGLQFNIVVED